MEDLLVHGRGRKEGRKSSGKEKATPEQPGQGNLSTYEPSLCNRQVPEETSKWHGENSSAPKPRNVRKNRAAVWCSGLVRENGNWYQMWGFCFRDYCAAKKG